MDTSRNVLGQQKELQTCPVLFDILEGLKDSVLALDQNWNIIYANKRIAQVFGCQISEMIGKNIWQLLPCILGTEIEVNFRTAMANRKAIDFEFEGIYKTGHFEMHIAPLPNGLAIYTKDITERKKSEIELIRKNIAIDKAQNAIFIMDPSFRILTWNKGAEDLYGYTAQEMVGHETDILETRFTNSTLQKVREALSKRGRWDGMAVQKRKDGSEIYVLINLTQISDGGTVIGYTGIMRDVTELKRMEEELSRSKQRTHDILESIDDNVYSLDRNWNFIYINRSAAIDWGYDPPELIGKNIWQLLPRFVGTTLEANFRRSMDRREVRRFEWHALYVKGILEVSVFPSAEGITIHAKNINERKKAEAELMQSEERFAKVFHSSPAAMFISRLDDGYIIDVNQTFLKLLGYRYDEVVGHTDYELNLYSDPNTRTNFVRLLGTKHTLRDYELTMQTKTRRPLTIMVSLDTIGINSQELLLGIFIDITERKKAEDALKQSERRLKMAQQIAHLGSWEFNVKENKAVWSEELFRIFDLPSKPFGPSIEEYQALIHPDDLERVIDLVQPFTFGMHKVGDMMSFDYRIRLGDGSVRVLHTERMIEEVNPEGKPFKIAGIEQDITERKRIELELERYSKHLERLVEERSKQLKDAERLAAIGATAGMVGHDIRNPLQAITNELYLARQSIESSPEVSNKPEVLESVQFIQDQVNYINKIVSDLQDYARPLRPSFSEVEVDVVIADSLRTLTVPKNVQAVANFEDSLPKIETDPVLLKRVLVNLATNALQAMPNGGKLTVWVQHNKEANKLVLTVEDTGVGIPKDVQKKLFTPLFTTKSKGQGFGLAVVKRLTEALGGNITFESEAGKGTKFIIELPTR